jgi:amino acid transporter
MAREIIITILITLIIYLSIAVANFQTLPVQAQGESKNTNEAIS